MLEPCLLQPCVHVAGNTTTVAHSRVPAPQRGDRTSGVLMLALSLSLSLYVYIYIYMYIYIYIYIHVVVCLLMCLFVCLFIYVCIHMYREREKEREIHTYTRILLLYYFSQAVLLLSYFPIFSPCAKSLVGNMFVKTKNTQSHHNGHGVVFPR